MAEGHLGVKHGAHGDFRVTKIVRGLSGLCAYQPVFSGKDGSVRAKSAGQSLLDENLQVHNSIITHCFVMVIALSVQALSNIWRSEFLFDAIRPSKQPRNGVPTRASLPLS